MTKIDLCQLKVKTSDGTVNSAFSRSGTAATLQIFAENVRYSSANANASLSMPSSSYAPPIDIVSKDAPQITVRGVIDMSDPKMLTTTPIGITPWILWWFHKGFLPWASDASPSDPPLLLFVDSWVAPDWTDADRNPRGISVASTVNSNSQGIPCYLVDYTVDRINRDQKHITEIASSAGTTIGDAVHDGIGLSDLNTGGTFSGGSGLVYVVEIDGTGTPDTFRWSDDGGASWDASTVSITGAAQTLNNGVTVTFGATTGHTSGDRWSFVAGGESVKRRGSLLGFTMTLKATTEDF